MRQKITQIYGNKIWLSIQASFLQQSEVLKISFKGALKNSGDLLSKIFLRLKIKVSSRLGV